MFLDPGNTSSGTPRKDAHRRRVSIERSVKRVRSLSQYGYQNVDGPLPSYIQVSVAKQHCDLHDQTATLEQLHTAFHNLLHLFILVLLRISTTVLLVRMTAMLLTRICTTPTAIGRCTPILTVATRRRRHLVNVSACQIDIYSTFIMLGLILQAQLLAHFLHSWLDLLNMISRMVALSNNDMQMRLSSTLSRSDPVPRDLLGLFYELSMQIDRVAGHVLTIVLPEHKFGRLLVISILRGAVLF
jgi:hypothetical protein